ncbi:hypothetical protein K458DRAFT_173865 [Lentithecium fluviatile CBS 122367]|uniref:Uncharacterized protein n=1 Tax=Lentithecium fluviatile CBS 122367 TaxID=1168545 RepID=A0A6G1JBT5_9PLEO|nr:hypothetical protein K458DRAFT_173865 [Lentithecium fluviatile CBS 122367]
MRMMIRVPASHRVKLTFRLAAVSHRRPGAATNQSHPAEHGAMAWISILEIGLFFCCQSRFGRYMRQGANPRLTSAALSLDFISPEPVYLELKYGAHARSSEGRSLVVLTSCPFFPQAASLSLTSCCFLILNCVYFRSFHAVAHNLSYNRVLLQSF